MACRIRRSTEWSCRLLHEITVSGGDACFITLTIDDEHLLGDSLRKRSVQLFIKRFRKALSPVKIKYYAVGEYGDLFQRPHYHIIIIGWSPSVSDLIEVGEYDGKKRWRSVIIEDCWPYGFNTVGDASVKSIDYCTGYVQKKLTGKFGKEAYGEKTPPFALISQGLGRRYVEMFHVKLKEDLFCMHNGVKTRLPRYYLSKLRVDKERLNVLRLEKEKEKEVKYRDLLGLSGASLLAAVERSERRQEEMTLVASKKLFIGVKE